MENPPKKRPTNQEKFPNPKGFGVLDDNINFHGRLTPEGEVVDASKEVFIAEGFDAPTEVVNTHDQLMPDGAMVSKKHETLVSKQSSSAHETDALQNGMSHQKVTNDSVHVSEIDIDQLTEPSPELEQYTRDISDFITGCFKEGIYVNDEEHRDSLFFHLKTIMNDIANDRNHDHFPRLLNEFPVGAIKDEVEIMFNKYMYGIENATKPSQLKEALQRMKGRGLID